MSRRCSSIGWRCCSGSRTMSTQTTSEYIAHHLTNLHVGHGFWTFHLDTLLISGVVGLLVFCAMGYAARRATSGVPGGVWAVVSTCQFIVSHYRRRRQARIAPTAVVRQHVWG